MNRRLILIVSLSVNLIFIASALMIWQTKTESAEKAKPEAVSAFRFQIEK